ncbi:MAG: desulfoferrodoxin [Gammaproteobacteria bacterium]|nr:MAG: desulfoferrodoxin [Deltaproteobacteria bacterium]PIE48157.1 MAG: desulfoferrodoxin [Gammaproteobacteria bacterium]
MNKKNDIFQCDICGSLVSVMKGGKGVLQCCGEKMIFLKPKTGDPASEKHIPFVADEKNGCFSVRTGKHLHPSVKAHYIGFIDAVFKNYVFRKFFYPGQRPEFYFEGIKRPVKFRSYCLIHGVFEYDV